MNKIKERNMNKIKERNTFSIEVNPEESSPAHHFWQVGKLFFGRWENYLGRWENYFGRWENYFGRWKIILAGGRIILKSFFSAPVEVTYLLK